MATALRRCAAGLPAEPAKVEMVPTGRTIGERWAELDTADRRKMLHDAGYTYYALNGRVQLMGPHHCRDGGDAAGDGISAGQFAALG